MANFNTHASIAFLGSGAVALFAVNSQLITLTETPWLVFLGIIGGLLPDIDSDNTKQVKVIFFLLALIATFTLLTEGSILQGLPGLLPSNKAICHATSLEFYSLLKELSNHCLPYSLIVVSISTYLFVRYFLLFIFTSLTSHRGVFHSILAAIFFALLAACISYYFLKQGAVFSWLSGSFISIGFIIHLLLDEIYSVDLSNARMKRSFGSALKLYGYRSTFSSIFMLLCTVYLYTLTPPAPAFIKALHVAHNKLYDQETRSNILSTWTTYLLSNLKGEKKTRS